MSDLPNENPALGSEPPPGAGLPPKDSEDPLPTDQYSTTGDIHEILQSLRRKEVAGLAHSPTNLRSTYAADHYGARFVLETSRYIRYVFETWIGLAVASCFGGLGPFDWFTLFFFAAGGTIVLFGCLIFCLIINSPILVEGYKRWAEKSAGGLGLANNWNPNLFKSMTASQIKAAKQFLSRDVSNSKDTDSERYFNYDAAKLLLQFSAIVYEHRNESIRDAIAAQHKGEAAKGAATGSLPLSQPKNKSVEISDMYNEKIDDALAHYGNKIIHEFCHLCEIEFEPVSELNATSSAFAGLFWDPKSNWIVVTFKGTSPIEFGELLSDLNTKMINVGSNIPGFKKVHKGFRECVYPEDVTLTGGVRPYDTILSGVKALAKWLKNNNGLPGSPKINIWFTGHSLGCATASLTYCRMLMRPKDLGKRSILRDAYMFAAPILTDRESVDVFNSKMLEDPEKPKTMWRITSNWDAVATLLPELGDYTNITVSPNNAFAFAHLGTELRLRDYPKMPGAIGNHLYYGAKIYMETVFSKDQLLDQRKTAWGKEGEEHRIWLARLYQSIPLIGRVFAHFTTNYWDQLDRSGFEGEAEWISDW